MTEEVMEDFTDLNAAIDAAAEQAISADYGELSRQRALALDAFQGKIIDEADEGRSSVQDWSVFETAQWILPSLTRIFAGGDDIVEFEPVGPDDEDLAKQESMYLNYVVTQKNNWFMTCLEWFQDALITKNAYCMAAMVEVIDTEVEDYENQSEEQVAMLLDDGVQVIQQQQFDDPEDDGVLIDPTSGQRVQDEVSQVGALAMYQEMGEEPIIQRRQLFNLRVRKDKPRKELQFTVLPPEHCKVGADTTSASLRDCNYFEFEQEITISDLRKQGVNVPDDIVSDDMEDTEEDESRDDEYQSSVDPDSPDATLKFVNARHIWIRHDYDEDGIAEMQYVLRIGSNVVEHLPASRVPVASIVPFINTHRHIGTSVADLTFDIQRIKTSMLRNGLDSLNLAVNGRHAVSNKVSIDDLLTVRPGGIVQVETDLADVAGHVVPIPSINTFPDAQNGMQYMEAVIESRVGVNRQFQGIDEGLSNEHNRIGQLSSMAAQRVEQIARIFANGIEDLFEIAHELIIKSGHSKQTFKLRGDWVDVDPSSWRTGRDLRMVAPFAAGNKDSLLQRLMLIGQIQEKMLLGGLPTVDIDDVYSLALDTAAAADLTGRKYFTDPATVPPKQPEPDPAMMALEIENKKADNEAIDEGRKAETDRIKIATDAETKERIARLNSATQIVLARLKDDPSADTAKIEEIELLVEEVAAQVDDALVQTADMKSEEKAQAKANNDQRLDAILKDMNRNSEKIGKALENLSKPRKVIREDGRIVGTEVAK